MIEGTGWSLGRVHAVATRGPHRPLQVRRPLGPPFNLHRPRGSEDLGEAAVSLIHRADARPFCLSPSPRQRAPRSAFADACATTIPSDFREGLPITALGLRRARRGGRSHLRPAGGWHGSMLGIQRSRSARRRHDAGSVEPRGGDRSVGGRRARLRRKPQLRPDRRLSMAN